MLVARVEGEIVLQDQRGQATGRWWEWAWPAFAVVGTTRRSGESFGRRRKRYPLLVVIHGGPTGVSRPTLSYGGTYPVSQFLAKGAVVLMPNYRGSSGYGEKFRSLNVRNLGVGDAWDVLSGVDAMIARGIADSTRLASMGWSQGGYISAFLTTTSQRFKAISVGAGISDWMTYYVATDITPFTRQYLQSTPVERPRRLREDVTDHLHQAGEDSDVDSARRARSARADLECV